MTDKKHAYGVITAVAMIIGIVIGSGIYFKADDILTFTGGNMFLGFVVLAIGACNIIFGSLTLSELAKREHESGGIVAYLERFSNSAIASGFGWFQAFVFMPSVSAIVSWVSGIYTGVVFGWELTFEQQVLLGCIYILLFTAINILSKKLGGYFQSLATFIKLVPFAIIAIAGIFWSNPHPAIPADVAVIEVHDVGLGWLSALVPLAFAYEGWSFVTSIAHELRDPKRDLVRALILGPIIILMTYLLFFFGMNRILGPSFILSTGDAAISFALTAIFGESAGKLLMIVVLISILGVLNGVLLANMRIPQILAEKQMLKPAALAHIQPKYQLSLFSSLAIAIVSLAWLVIHYIVQITGALPKNDVSEIAIVFNYLWYLFLYAIVLRLYKQKVVTNKLTGLFAPIIASAGSLLVIVGSLISSFSMTLFFMGICMVVVIAGYLFYKHQHKNSPAS